MSAFAHTDVSGQSSGVAGNSRLVVLTAAFFVTAIFYGDVWVGITVPLCMAALPILIVRGSLRPTRMPAGCFVLGALCIPVALQMVFGVAPKGKSDLVVYLPIVYGVLTILAFRATVISDNLLWKSLVAGGLLSGAVMLAMALFAEPDTVLVPGQQLWRTDLRYYAQKKEEAERKRREGHLTSAPAPAPDSATAPLQGSVPGLVADAVGAPPQDPRQPPEAAGQGPDSDGRLQSPTVAVPNLAADALAPGAAPQDSHAAGPSPHPGVPFQSPAVAVPEQPPPIQLGKTETEFYRIKNQFRNALGLSNYLAVFFVFLAAAALFQHRGLSLVFAALAAVTLSRLGLVCMVIVVAAGGAFYFGFRREVVLPLLTAGFAVTAGLVLLLGLFPATPMAEIPTSFTVRFELWSSGVRALWLSPVFGSPRSAILDHFGVSILWNPHNSLLMIASYFGLIGLFLYGMYLVVALSAIYKACSSWLWVGLFIGISVLLIASVVEPIVLSPPFEILLATLYSQARIRNVAAERATSGFSQRDDSSARVL